MGLEEVQQLGIETVLKLSALRESLMEVHTYSTYGSLTSTRVQVREDTRPATTVDFTAKLRKLFRT